MTTQHKIDIIHIKYRGLYRYKGVTFDVAPYCGVEVFNRTGERARKYQQVSGRQWALIAKFMALPKQEQERYAL